VCTKVRKSLQMNYLNCLKKPRSHPSIRVCKKRDCKILTTNFFATVMPAHRSWLLHQLHIFLANWVQESSILCKQSDHVDVLQQQFTAKLHSIILKLVSVWPIILCKQVGNQTSTQLKIKSETEAYTGRPVLPGEFSILVTKIFWKRCPKFKYCQQ
jgi:hypothetical protein